jgi:methyl-accepting chemotaxis protein
MIRFMKQDKKDRLEEYILQNRKEFDNLDPSDKVWRNIDQKLSGKDKRPAGNYNFLWKAAAIVLLAVSAFLFVERQQMIVSQEEIASVEDINPDFNEAEDYFIQQINEKKQIIHQYRNEYGELTDEFESDIQKLDNMYLQLKEELKQSNTEYVVDALIQNLQLRIEILNQQLKIIEDIKNAKENEWPSPSFSWQPERLRRN